MSPQLVNSKSAQRSVPKYCVTVKSTNAKTPFSGMHDVSNISTNGFVRTIRSKFKRSVGRKVNTKHNAKFGFESTSCVAVQHQIWQIEVL